MRSRTLVSSPAFWRRFDIDALAITRSLTTMVPYSTTVERLAFGLPAGKKLRVMQLSPICCVLSVCGTQWYQCKTRNFREESKELNNENGNVLPAAGVRDGLGAPGARSIHTTAAQDHRRADDPYAKTGGYGRASHENHARGNSCDRSPVSRRQNSAVVHARRRQGRDLHTELQRRSRSSGAHRKPDSFEGKPRGRAVHSGRATLAARNTIAR